MKRLIIIGASGHGKVVADCAVKNGYGDIVFLDDDERLEKCGSYPVVGRSSEVDKLTGDILVAIGNPGIRQKLQAQINKERLAVLIHPKERGVLLIRLVLLIMIASSVTLCM